MCVYLRMKASIRLLALTAGLALPLSGLQAQPPSNNAATPNWGGPAAATAPSTWGRPTGVTRSPVPPLPAAPATSIPPTPSAPSAARAVAPTSSLQSRGATIQAPAATAQATWGAAQPPANRQTLTPVQILNPHPTAVSPMLTLLRTQINGATGERTEILASRQAAAQTTPAAPAGDAPLTRVSDVAATTLRHGDPNAKLPSSPQARLLPCQQGKLGVYTMNGAGPAAMVFTPDPQYDLYTFQGCHFGNTPGQLTLIGHFKGFKLPLTVVEWTDTSIIAALDTGVTGEPDENGTVSLLMSRSDGQRLQFDGNSFYAVRASITLQTIPQSWATLGAVYDVSKVRVTPSYLLGGPQNISVTVRRESSDRFNGGQDYYDLSLANPQFSMDSMAVIPAGTDCPASGIVTRYVDGQTTAKWDPQGNIVVSLGGTTCHYANPSRDDATETYTLQLNATGPRGVDPTQPL